MCLVMFIIVKANSKGFSTSKTRENDSILLGVVFFSIPFILIQIFLADGFEKLHTVKHLSEISNYKDKRYLKFDDIRIDTSNISVDFDQRYEGKGVMLYVYSYVAAPIISDDTISNIMIYREDYIKMRPNDPVEFKKVTIKNFEERIINEAFNGELFKNEYLEHINEEFNYWYYKYMPSRNEKYSDVSILRVRKKKFEDRNGSLEFWIIFTSIVAFLVLMRITYVINKNHKVNVIQENSD